MRNIALTISMLFDSRSKRSSASKASRVEGAAARAVSPRRRSLKISRTPNVLGGVSLASDYDMENAILVNATEVHSEGDLDLFAVALKEVLA